MNKIEVRLACRHHAAVTYGLEGTGSAYCRFHGWQKISVVFHEAVHMFCADCRMSRWYGQSPSRANAAAERHEQNNPHHRTFVRWDAVTRDGKGIEREKVLTELATQAKLWDTESTAHTSDVPDIIPF